MGRKLSDVWPLALVAVAAVSPAAFAQTPRPAAGPARRPAEVARPQAGQPAQTQAARPQAKPTDPRMKQLLAEWEKRSARLNSLSVRISRVDEDPAWDEKVRYEGRAFLESPNRACLDFKKVIEATANAKAKLVDFERIVCTGSEVWQYRSDTKQIFIFPLDKESQKRALEEGPLPFLFNMRAAEAEARYQMSVLRETSEYSVISVLPRLNIDKESFQQAFLQLNRSTYLPMRIVLISPNGKARKDFTLSEVHENVKIPPENFQGRPLPKPWQVVRDLGDEKAAPPQRLGTQPPAGAPAGSVPRRR